MTQALTALPANALRDHLAILGTTGAGKTFAAKGEVEALLDAGRRAFVIDPTGAWWGLRLTEDGDSPSRFKLPIFGGLGPKGRVPPYCDVPIAATGGARLAELLAEGEFSGILDVSRMMVGERTRLLTDFAETLAATNRRPLHLVIDESHLMLPQGRVQDPQSGKMLAAGNHLLSGGRLLGLRVMLLSQRAAKLHKDSLSMASTLVAMRSVSPQDRGAIADWIRDVADPKAGRDVLASLPGLPAGEGWIWAPTLDVLSPVKFRPITTFDSSATPDDDAPVNGPKLGDLDLQALRTALTADDSAPATAGAPKHPVAQLDQAFNAGREAERKDAAARPLVQDARVQRLIRNAERGGALRALQGLQSEITAIIGREIAHLPMYVVEPNEGPAAAPPAAEATGVGRDPAVGPSAPPALPNPAPAERRPARKTGESGLPVMAENLFEAARCGPERALTWPEVAVLAGVSPVSGPFHAAKRALLEAGLMRDAGGGRVVPADRHEASDCLTQTEVVEAWRKKLGAMAARLLGALFVRSALSKASAAEELGVSAVSGPYHAGWKKLRANELIEAVDGDLFQLAGVIRDLPRGS